MSIVPIKGRFENAKAFLLHIADDEDLDGFMIFVRTKQGTMKPAHLKFSRQEMAFAGAVALSWAQESDDS